MRAGKCVLCGTALLEGGGRDRRYCGESCRAMAYRKRRGAATSTTGEHPSRARAASGADLAPIVVVIAQQLKQLLEDVESIKKRLATLEAQAPPPSARTAPVVEQAREVMQALHSILGAGSAPRKSASPASAAPEPSTQAAPVPSEDTSTPGETPQTQLPPWMAASPKDPAQLVPRWTLWSPRLLDGLNAAVERMLDTIPDVIAKQGEPHAAERLRQWIASDKPLVLQVATLMARRIAATLPAARASAQQQVDLAQVAARDIEDSLPREPADQWQRLARFLSQEPRVILLLGVCLTAALRSFDGSSAPVNP